MPVIEPYENPDLKRERATCSFDRLEITNLLDGGPDKTKDRIELENYILSVPELREEIPPEFLSHEERYATSLKLACKLVKKLDDSPIGQVDTLRASSELELDRPFSKKEILLVFNLLCSYLH